jgi:hypothetical protein
MLSNTLMLVRTHPQDPAREQEFNDWYNGNHVPDVLNAPYFEAAIRYKVAKTHVGHVPSYLALYYVTQDDVPTANRELLKYLDADEPRRLPMPEATGEAEDWEIAGEDGGVRTGGLVSVDTWAWYTKTRESGENHVSPQSAPKALLCVYSAPAKGADIEGLSAWYDRHMEDILASPGFLGGARYELVSINAGTITRWCAIYQLDTDDVDGVQAELLKTMASASAGGVPTMDDGKPALDVDGYAYLTLAGAPNKVHTLLP